MVVTNVTQVMDVMASEVFGPIAPIIVAKEEEDAVLAGVETLDTISL